MTRISVGDGMWFDKNKAEAFDESKTWDGNNHISDATGSQFEHERLFRTAKGKWVLNEWSQWQGTHERWNLVDDDTAAAWLVKQGHQDAADKYFPEQVSASEV